MPTYEYRAKDPKESCPFCVDGFDIAHSMHAPRLKVCPRCGAPVERVISRVNVSSPKWTKNLTSDSNLKKHGFTKLVNEGDGKFRKTI